MSAFNGLKFTQKGLNLQAKAQIGTELQYTRIGIGDGHYTGNILDITNIVHQVMSLPITSLSVKNGQARVGSALSNADLTVGFYLREIGVFAIDPDEGEILYCYANAGNFAGYVPPAGGGDVVEKEVELITTVGTAPNVTANIDPSVFATIGAIDTRVAVVLAALNEHASDNDIHVTSSQKATWNSKQNALGFTPENVANKGVAGGYAGLDLTAKIPTSQLPDSILGQVEYISTWNASTNTPVLPNAATVKGHYYVTETAGIYNGIDFKVGDWVISNGGEWQKVDNTDAVPTVFGRTGNILAAPGDYSADKISLNNPRFVSADVAGALDELFQSVSSGKTLVAAAITDKGTPTAATDSFAKMADNISQISSSSAGKDWAVRTYTGDAWLTSVCYGNGMFVAVANYGEIAGNRVMTSSDGVTWTARATPADNAWISVCYGNGLFVAVAYSGTGNRVMTSTDGINWTSRTSAADNGWMAVCYGNGLFVAVANSGTSGNRVMTSSDGVTWTIRTSAADNGWNSVCYGNGIFVAVSQSGIGNRVMTSPDGINWTTRTSAADNSWQSVCYGNGLFVAVSISGTGNRVMTSPDGINWTIRTSAADNQWYSVCYGNGLFVAVANSGTSGKRVMTSPDGVTWTIRTSPANTPWQSVCYGNGVFIALAYVGTGDRVMASGALIDPSLPQEFADRIVRPGVVWTQRPGVAADMGWRSVAYGNGLFVAVATSGTGSRMMTSPDGINWTPRATVDDTSSWNSVCYGNGLFVAVASGGTSRIMTSPDGITWTARTAPNSVGWLSVCYYGTIFVAVGSGTSNAMTSTDGITWTARSTPSTTSWYSVCYGNGLFVAVAPSGSYQLMTSSNGSVWTGRTPAAALEWYSVCFGNGTFVAVAINPNVDSVMTSKDGINWTMRPVKGNYWRSVCYGNGIFVAVGMSPTGGNRVMTSIDGINWTTRPCPDGRWYAVGCDNGRFVAVGGTNTDSYGRAIMTSGI